MGKSVIRKYLLSGAIALLLTVYPPVGALAQSPGFNNPPADARDEHPETAQASKAKAQDAKTRLKRFPQNLGSNFLAIFGKDNLKAFVVGVAATELSTAADDPVHGHFRGRNHATAFTNVGETVGQAYVMAPAVCGLLLAGHYSRNDRFHSFTYALAQGYAINAGLASALKSSSQRERPDGSDHRAFPSTHAASLFMIAAATESYFGKKAGILGYGIASYVAISRMAKDVHWTSDVVAGSTLGYIVGRTVSRKTGVSLRPQPITVLPGFNPKSKSYYLKLYINFPE